MCGWILKNALLGTSGVEYLVKSCIDLRYSHTLKLNVDLY